MSMGSATNPVHDIVSEMVDRAMSNDNIWHWRHGALFRHNKPKKYA